MQKQDDDHGAGAVSMQAAEERARGHGFGNVGDRGVRVIGGGNIVERKKYSGDDLRNEDE